MSSAACSDRDDERHFERTRGKPAAVAGYACESVFDVEGRRVMWRCNGPEALCLVAGGGATGMTCLWKEPPP